MSETMTIPAKERTYAVIAEFAGPNELLTAAERVRDAGYKRWDVHSPFPIHGMDDAMGAGQSKVGLIAGACGAVGLVSAFVLQYWTQAVDYPQVIAGKPYNSYQAWVIVCFGVTILFSALGAVFAMLILNRLPMWFNGLFYSERFSAKVNDDGFFISIEAEDAKFDPTKTEAFLQSIGGGHVEVVRGA
jgi:hypothetical protein